MTTNTTNRAVLDQANTDEREPADYYGTLAADLPDVEIRRLMPGFHVRLKGTLADAMPEESREKTTGTWTAAVQFVLAARTVAREAGYVRTR